MYLVLLDYSTGAIVKIKLTEKEIRDSKGYEDFEDFMMKRLEKRYHFRVADCSWMVTRELQEYTY